MNNRIRADYLGSGACFLAFLGLIVALRQVDLQPIGPGGSVVGLGSLNLQVWKLWGQRPTWQVLTDWLGCVPLLFAAGFAAFGLGQLLRRRSLRKVDADILLLGLLYLAVIVAYIVFEANIVNFRPVLVDGKLEASFPSSHTLVGATIMATSILQFQRRVSNRGLRLGLRLFCLLVIGLTVLGRLVSGLHWPTDILGGSLLSASLCLLYRALSARAGAYPKQGPIRHRP